MSGRSTTKSGGGRYNSPLVISGDDKIKNMQRSLGETRIIMIDNIAQVAERGEIIEDLQQKSHELVENSRIFKDTTLVVKRKMMCQNHRLIIICVIIGIVVAIIIGLFIYGAVNGHV
jgi:vesicle-associated membrane protein 7